MTPETFFEHFALLADALNGVQKLREMILLLAVQGKLVPQDPNDEPASVLLEKIEAKKGLLVKNERSKNAKLLLSVRVDEMPFSLPKGWLWVRCGEIQIFTNGFVFKSSDYQTGGIGIVRIGDIKNGEIYPNEMKRVSADFLNLLDEKLRVSPGDLLIAMSGATTGKLGFNKTEETFLLNQRVGKLEFLFVDPEYAYFYLTTKIQENLQISLGSAIPNLSTAQINAMVFPLPPEEEQHRIVAKVDQLMALCKELEAQQQKRNESRTRLSTAAIDKLLTAREPDEFAEHWQRICDHFDLLSDTPESIGQFRQAILQLAVQGKLVPQDPNDEPADVLLEKIEVEKERLVKQGKAGRGKRLLAIRESERLFDIPESWSWRRLGEVCHFASGFAFKSGDYVPTSSNQLIRLGNVKNAQILLDQNAVFIPDSLAQANEEFLLKENDLLTTMTGTKAKRDYLFTAIVAREHLAERQLFLNQRVGVLRFFIPKMELIASLFLKADPILDYMFGQATGTANQGNIGAATIRNLLFPVPPLNEQHRIVAKVDQLMSLCDKLEIKLKQSQIDSGNLMDAMVQNLLAA